MARSAISDEVSMTFRQAFGSWLTMTCLFAGIGCLALLSGTLLLVIVGRNVMVPLWLVPALLAMVGGLAALPSTISRYRNAPPS
jgi:hypothetical protein